MQVCKIVWVSVNASVGMGVSGACVMKVVAGQVGSAIAWAGGYVPRKVEGVLIWSDERGSVVVAGEKQRCLSISPCWMIEGGLELRSMLRCVVEPFCNVILGCCEVAECFWAIVIFCH